MSSKIKSWIEAVRLRTLPVSTAGVILAIGYAAMASPTINVTVAILCLLFAILAQIASNFANEYYDFRHGLDRPGREGPRRGVTEGDITPRAMLTATYATLGVACAIGLSLIYWGGWWLLPAGVAIALGVVAYSAGPYPLSHHGLGEVAVMIFFGIVPVNLTYYVMTLQWSLPVFIGSLTAGLMGANVLIVNNYRDTDDDMAVGKHTLAVIAGRPVVRTLYLINGIVAMLLALPVWMGMEGAWWLFPLLCLVPHVMLWRFMGTHTGASLNPLLGMTSMLMLFYALCFTVITCFVS
ncbi:MAG: 1,4-dihydroxy-2-naphthoate octaprenyltransferase [Barnesiella sp.]|nr:1,4-dihydroxy-2-naphthoate octaprenyltransferase [Barnesiella sp.]